MKFSVLLATERFDIGYFETVLITELTPSHTCQIWPRGAPVHRGHPSGAAISATIPEANDKRCSAEPVGGSPHVLSEGHRTAGLPNPVPGDLQDGRPHASFNTPHLTARHSYELAVGGAGCAKLGLK